MGSIREFWKGLFSRGSKSDAPAPEKLEREISALSSGNLALADDMQRIRSDLEHTREEEDRKIANLEQVRQSMELAREQDHRKLVEFESINQELQSARDADSKRILELEKRLSGIESGHNEVHKQARALEDSLTETKSRLEKTDAGLEDLLEKSKQQASQFEASLTNAGNRLESTDNQLRKLEGRLVDERKDNLTILQQMQATMRKQDTRMGWTMAAAAFAMLLGATAGGILIWDVQKNAVMLSGMSADIKELMSSVNGHLASRHRSGDEARQQAVLPVPAPESRPPVAAAVPPGQESNTAKEAPPVPAPAASATVKKPATNPYFLSSALERGRPKQTEGLRQTMRKETEDFFRDNAKLEGVISMESGVQYRVVTPGSGKAPLPGDKVVVKYLGTTLDGNIFDETYTADEPSVFSVNELQPGWREVMLKMEEGTEFELYVPPDMATSGSVRKRGVLGYEPSIYLIELLQVMRDEAAESPASAR